MRLLHHLDEARHAELFDSKTGRRQVVRQPHVVWQVIARHEQHAAQRPFQFFLSGAA